MLSQYEKLNVPEFLDGRYFEKVMKSLDRYIVVPEPLVIRVDSYNKIYSNKEAFTQLFTYTAPTMYARIILEQINEDNEVTTRHSQLLIISKDRVVHFEPDFEDNELYRGIVKFVRGLFPEHELKQKALFYEGVRSTDKTTEVVRPVGGYCVAYVLKYAYFHARGEKVRIGDLDDIRQFSRTVEFLYGPCMKGVPDIEFGHNTTRNTLVGGLLGGGLGYAVAGPAGGLLGAGGGALIGSSIGNDDHYRYDHHTYHKKYDHDKYDKYGDRYGRPYQAYRNRRY